MIQQFKMTFNTRTFQILFSKQDKTFQGGDVIDGNIFVSLKSATQFQMILLKIVGKSKCGWSEGR